MSVPEHPPDTWDLDAPDLDVRAVFAVAPTPCVFLDTRLQVLDANPAYLAAVGRLRDAVVGRDLFEVFPDDHRSPSSAGASLRSSLERARETGRPEARALARHDIRTADGERREERWWSAVTVPLRDSSGEVTVLAHRVEDVTAFVRAPGPGPAGDGPGHPPTPAGVTTDTDVTHGDGELRRHADELQEENTHLHVAVAEGRSSALKLQQAMLTDLPEPDHLHLVAAYAPAGEHQEVGGDWYDAFTLADGATALVIGDVTGHDLAAAAQMGALRNVLRTTAYLNEEPPSRIMGATERVVAGLGMGVLATLVMMRIEQTPEDRARGMHQLRWTNAGHPPPLLLSPDGEVRRLDAAPELLLGLGVEAPRTDHVTEVPTGSTLLLYTDGLVEQRGRSLDEGIRALEVSLAEAAELPMTQLLEWLRRTAAGTRHDDDIATLAVRFHDQDAARPASAGPRYDPTSTALATGVASC